LPCFFSILCFWQRRSATNPNPSQMRPLARIRSLHAMTWKYRARMSGPRLGIIPPWAPSNVNYAQAVIINIARIVLIQKDATKFMNAVGMGIIVMTGGYVPYYGLSGNARLKSVLQREDESYESQNSHRPNRCPFRRQ